MLAGPDLLCQQSSAWDPGLDTIDGAGKNISQETEFSSLHPLPPPHDLDQSHLLSLLIFVILSRSDISVVALILETLVKLLKLGPQFSSYKMGRLDLIPHAIPKACVSGLERHFSASENGGLGTWLFRG